MRIISNTHRHMSKTDVTASILLKGNRNPQVCFWDGIEPTFLRQVNTEISGTVGSQWNWFGAGSNNRLWDNFNTVGEALDYVLNQEKRELWYFSTWREAYQYMLNK